LYLHKIFRPAGSAILVFHSPAALGFIPAAALAAILATSDHRAGYSVVDAVAPAVMSLLLCFAVVKDEFLCGLQGKTFSLTSTCMEPYEAIAPLIGENLSEKNESSSPGPALVVGKNDRAVDSSSGSQSSIVSSVVFPLLSGGSYWKPRSRRLDELSRSTAITSPRHQHFLLPKDDELRKQLFQYVAIY
jgi:hypothetical protein